MSARIDIDRREITDANSPLRHHNRNQHHMKDSDEGWKRLFQVPKKEVRLQTEEEKIQQIERDRLARVIAHVAVSLRFPELYDSQLVPSEISYLKKLRLPDTKIATREINRCKNCPLLSSLYPSSIIN